MKGHTMLNLNKVEEMASDYNISTQTIKELYYMYNCLDTITLLLDKLIIKDLHKRKIT
tara:strand:+ start:1315 stop:1488 length:174 start_codon:yes stop_codon:yes gene_type:complete